MAKRRRSDTAQEKAAVATDETQLYNRESTTITGRQLRVDDLIVTQEGYTKAKRHTITDPETGEEFQVIEPPRRVLKVKRVKSLLWSRKGTHCTVNNEWVYDVAGEVKVVTQ